jgi:hypothetical protein
MHGQETRHETEFVTSLVRNLSFMPIGPMCNFLIPYLKLCFVNRLNMGFRCCVCPTLWIILIRLDFDNE